ncbi:MAG: TlpA disulfide reductase family protein [Bacteroidota bacterium]
MRFVFLLLCCSLSFLSFGQNPLVDKTLPNLSLKNLDGQTVNVADLGKNGKITVISFWAVWCIPCQKELDNLALLSEDWQTEFDLEIIAISTDDTRTTQKVKSLVNGNDWPFEVLLDPNGDMKRAMAFQLIPHTILVDADGKIAYVHSGYVEGDEYVLEDEIRGL